MPQEVGQQQQGPRKPRSRRAQNMNVAGAYAVIKRLESAGMQVGKVEIYRGCRMTWEAATNRGARWVRRTSAGWEITKVPPEQLGDSPCR